MSSRFFELAKRILEKVAQLEDEKFQCLLDSSKPVCVKVSEHVIWEIDVSVSSRFFFLLLQDPALAPSLFFYRFSVF